MKTIIEYLQSGHNDKIDPNTVEPSEEEQYRNAIKTELMAACKGVKTVSVGKWNKDLFIIKLDYLEKKDWPNAIADNSIYLNFDYYVDTQTCEYRNGGHLDLTTADKEGKYKYYALKSFTAPYKDAGHKLMRKTKCKDMKKLIDTISTFANAVYDEAVKDQGAPLKRK